MRNVCVSVFVINVRLLDSEYLDDRSQIKVHTDETNGHRLITALSVPWWSPIQVLTEVDVT